MKNKTEEIKEITEEFFKKFGWDVEISVEIVEKVISIKIDVDNPPLLIGRGGESLQALQHILRLMINNKLDEFVPIVVDVANYKDRRRIFLEEESIEKAELVKKTGKEIELGPMNSYERRIVHMALKNIEGVEAESAGEGSERRIVIRPE